MPIALQFISRHEESAKMKFFWKTKQESEIEKEAALLSGIMFLMAYNLSLEGMLV